MFTVDVKQQCNNNQTNMTIISMQSFKLTSYDSPNVSRYEIAVILSKSQFLSSERYMHIFYMSVTFVHSLKSTPAEADYTNLSSL